MRWTGILLFAIALFAQTSKGQSLSCQSALMLPSYSLPTLSSNPLKQWLIWEQTSNLPNFRQDTGPIKIKYSLIPSDLVKVAIHKSTPESLKNLLKNGRSIRWFKHPFNKDSQIPYFHDLEVGEITGYFTSSRSIVFILGGRPYSIKLPVDKPHGDLGILQTKKATVKDDIKEGLARLRHIERVQKEIGKDPEFQFAKELVLVQDQISKEGYLIRDLGDLNDGHFYLPAFSIPYVGAQIARHHGFEPSEFWRIHYAEKIGRIKAKLLLQYGLQMVSPNSQNFLIQMDKDMTPTGKIIIRDIGDSSLVITIAEALGYSKQLEEDKSRNVQNTFRLRPFGSNSFWLMDQAPNTPISTHTILTDWFFAHNRAYTEYLSKALRMDFQNFPFLDFEPGFESVFQEVYTRAKIKDYQENLKYQNLSKEKRKD